MLFMGENGFIQSSKGKESLRGLLVFKEKVVCNKKELQI